MPRFCLFLGLTLAACTQFPQLDEAVSDQARKSAYPGLEPVDEVLAQAETPAGQDLATEIGMLQNRAQLLKARAAILRQTQVVDGQSQARMKAAYDRLTR